MLYTYYLPKLSMNQVLSLHQIVKESFGEDLARSAEAASESVTLSKVPVTPKDCGAQGLPEHSNMQHR